MRNGCISYTTLIRRLFKKICQANKCQQQTYYNPVMRMTWNDAMEPRGSDDNRFKASRALSVINVPRTRRGWYFIALGCLMAFYITVILQKPKDKCKMKNLVRIISLKRHSYELTLVDSVTCGKNCDLKASLCIKKVQLHNASRHRIMKSFLRCSTKPI